MNGLGRYTVLEQKERMIQIMDQQQLTKLVLTPIIQESFMGNMIQFSQVLLGFIRLSEYNG